MRKWTKKWVISRRRIKKWMCRLRGCISKCKRWVNGKWIMRSRRGWRSFREGWMANNKTIYGREVVVDSMVVRGSRVAVGAGVQSRSLTLRCRSWCGDVGWVEPRWLMQEALSRNWSICEQYRSKTWAHQRPTSLISSSQPPPRQPNSPKAPATSMSSAASRRPENSSMPFEKGNWMHKRMKTH